MPQPSQRLRGKGSASHGDSATWKPNSVPLSDRVFNLVLALALLAQGFLGFYLGRLALSPPKQKTAIVFREGAAWLMAAAMVVGALVLISVIVDHYDRRNNESSYKLFKWLSVHLGVCLFAASLVAHVYITLTR